MNLTSLFSDQQERTIDGNLVSVVAYRHRLFFKYPLTFAPISPCVIILETMGTLGNTDGNLDSDVFYTIIFLTEQAAVNTY